MRSSERSFGDGEKENKKKKKRTKLNGQCAARVVRGAAAFARKKPGLTTSPGVLRAYAYV